LTLMLMGLTLWKPAGLGSSTYKVRMILILHRRCSLYVLDSLVIQSLRCPMVPNWIPLHRAYSMHSLPCRFPPDVPRCVHLPLPLSNGRHDTGGRMISNAITLDQHRNEGVPSVLNPSCEVLVLSIAYRWRIRNCRLELLP